MIPQADLGRSRRRGPGRRPRRGPRGACSRFGLNAVAALRGQPAGERSRLAAPGWRPGAVRGQPLLAPGHPADPCSLPAEWRRKTAVAAAADYFFDTWWRATGSAIVFNTFPIERRGGDASSTPGRPARATAGTWWCSPRAPARPTAGCSRFRLGAAYLAVEHGVPVSRSASGVRTPRCRAVAAGPSPAGRRSRSGSAIRCGRPRARAPATSRRGSRRGRRRCSTRTRPPGGMPAAGPRAGTRPTASGPQVARWRRVWAQTAPPADGRRRGAWR